jgi:hypothetical protein
MAKRKTIGENPLDTIVPDRTAREKEQTAAATKPRPAVPVLTAGLRRPTQPASATVKSEKGTVISVPTTRTQSPAPTQQDLLSRVQSLEEQNKYISWLLGGAILLAVLL